MKNENYTALFRFNSLIIFIFILFILFYSNIFGPVGEFGAYVAIEEWDGIYGPFFRPLTLNLIPNLMDRLAGKNFSLYSSIFSGLFVSGLVVAVFLLRELLRWASAEEHALLHLAILTCFGFSNVYVVSTLMVQYTVTDFVFMTGYAVFLLSVLTILNNRQIGVRGSLLAAGSLAVMCASKEFTLVVPVVLALLVALRFRDAVALGARQPGRLLALLLLLGMVAAIYLALLLSKPTFVAASLAGAPPPGEDFIRAGFAKFLSNLGTGLLWLTQAPIRGNYPYVFNPLPLLDPVSSALSWAYATILLAGSAVALLSGRYRRVAMFQLLCIVYWCLVAASNNRVLSSYLAPAFLHLALLWAFGALVVLRQIKALWAQRLVHIGCIGLLCWSFWLGAAVLYSPHRDVSFHGAMAAVDTQYRSILRVVVMSHERFIVTFETRGAPDHVPFQLALGGAFSARTEMVLDGFAVDNPAQTFTVTGRRAGAAMAGEVSHIRVRAEADPALGTRLRIMPATPP